MAVAQRCLVVLALGCLLSPVAAPAEARASTIALSDLSTDATPASVLDATFAFMITGASELTLSVANDTSASNAYNLNGVWFNAAANVSGLALVTATHSTAGDVTADWNPVVTNDKAGGFGPFDFALIGGVGANDPSLIGPNETVDFVLAVSGTGPFAMGDFVALSEDGLVAAAKFVNGPGDDSAFGAAVPEPASAALLAAGLIGLAVASRRR